MVYQRIRILRKTARMKQAQVARILRCSPQTYSNYELGKRDIPTEVLIALAELYHTNVDYILGLTNTKTYYRDLQ